MKLEIRDMLPDEQKYSYTQSTQIMGQTGCIGHLRADMDTDGNAFLSSWNDHIQPLKTDEFKQEFNEVINALRFDPAYGEILKNRSSLQKYCSRHPSCQMEDGHSYGIRVNTDRYAYLCRLNPNKGEYNLYLYAYRKDWLNAHLRKAQKGIRFIDSNYRNLFRLPDGGKIEITLKDGQKRIETCRFIDEYHTEIGKWLYHICEFAERLEQNGDSIKPLTPPLEVIPGKEKTNADISR